MFVNKERLWKREESLENKTVTFRDKPYWEDCCCHPKESYVGSAQFSVWRRSEGIRVEAVHRIDVHVFNGKGWRGEGSSAQYVCIRYSDGPGNYASPGTLLDLLMASQRDDPTDHTYAVAALLIDYFMEIKATPRPV